MPTEQEWKDRIAHARVCPNWETLEWRCSCAERAAWHALSPAVRLAIAKTQPRQSVQRPKKASNPNKTPKHAPGRFQGLQEA